jgi:hypothetical protein
MLVNLSSILSHTLSMLRRMSVITGMGPPRECHGLAPLRRDPFWHGRDEVDPDRTPGASATGAHEPQRWDSSGMFADETASGITTSNARPPSRHITFSIWNTTGAPSKWERSTSGRSMYGFSG